MPLSKKRASLRKNQGWNSGFIQPLSFLFHHKHLVKAWSKFHFEFIQTSPRRSQKVIQKPIILSRLGIWKSYDSRKAGVSEPASNEYCIHFGDIALLKNEAVLNFGIHVSSRLVHRLHALSSNAI